MASHFTLECPPLSPPYPPSQPGPSCPGGELGPLSVHTPVVWELLMFVGVSVCRRTGFALPFFLTGRRARPLLSYCSESRTWGEGGGDRK